MVNSILRLFFMSEYGVELIKQKLIYADQAMDYLFLSTFARFFAGAFGGCLCKHFLGLIMSDSFRVSVLSEFWRFSCHR